MKGAAVITSYILHHNKTFWWREECCTGHRSVANFAQQNTLRCSRYSQKNRHPTTRSTM